MPSHHPGEARIKGMLGAVRLRNTAGREILIGSGFSEAQRRAPQPVGSGVVCRCHGFTAKRLPRSLRMDAA